MNLSDVYTEIRKNSTAKTLGGIRIVPLPAEQDTGLFVGIRSTSDATLLLFRCSSPPKTRSAKLPSCQAFKTRFVTYDEPSPATTWIELEQTKTMYSDQFMQVADSIIKQVEACAIPANRPARFIECVKGWRDAFKRTGAGNLSREEQAGLYAELWLLGTVLLPHVSDPGVAISGWTGPSGTPKDFQLDSCTVEMKTTTSSKEQKITISNATQLHTTGNPPLYVCFLQLEEAQGRGETLSARIALIRETLKGHYHLGIFNQQLHKARYRDPHSIYYDVRAYVYVSHSFFAVVDGFPCFQPNDLKEGMCDIKYSLQVGALANFRISQDDVIKRLKQPSSPE